MERYEPQPSGSGGTGKPPVTPTTTIDFPEPPERPGGQIKELLNKVARALQKILPGTN